MMMLETQLRSTPIHGVGVFLAQPARKDDLIWRFDACIDQVYPAQELLMPLGGGLAQMIKT